ncbi:hypothetical protein [Alkaliphilus metalliredigens]|nr:hypothetical protein [Alkaliphilus metalliredigens]
MIDSIKDKIEKISMEVYGADAPSLLGRSSGFRISVKESRLKA